MQGKLSDKGMESMKRKSLGIALSLMLVSSVASAGDYGFPALNTAGRYLGVGWSHHTYHSRVDGRFDAITNRHPASAYPSNALSHIYSPGYVNLPERQYDSSAANFWGAPIAAIQPMPQPGVSMQPGVSTQPKRAPEEVKATEQLPPKSPPKPQLPPKPIEPPPNWLKPYLDSQKKQAEGEMIELEQSPSDIKAPKVEEPPASEPRSTRLPGATNRYRG